MRVIVSSSLLVTQTYPAPTAMPRGWRPTGTRRCPPVWTSSRVTVFEKRLTTQTAPGPTAMSWSPSGIAIVLRMARVFGSTLTS